MIAVPEIHLALPADARRIAEMSRDFVEQGLGWSWRVPRVLRSIGDAATNVALIRERNGLQGFGIMHYADDSAHLVLLAVRPSRQRRGLGAALVAWLEKSAATAGIGQIRVEARADNPAAIAFYLGLGYNQTAITQGYYSGVIAAVRFEKKLWGGVSSP